MANYGINKIHKIEVHIEMKGQLMKANAKRPRIENVERNLVYWGVKTHKSP